MSSVVADQDFTKLVFRADPFSRMDSALRYELLSLSRPAQFSDGEYFYRKGLPPDEVFVLLSGTIRTFGYMPGTEGRVALGEHGPGACIGWDSALADFGETEAIAQGIASGIVIAADDFIRIARQDAALRKAILAQPSIGEVWRVVIAELHRRGIPVNAAEAVVKKLSPSFIARDWPAMRSEIEAKRSFTWLVAGGSGVLPGTLWRSDDGTRWARLIGVPAEKLEAVMKRFAATDLQGHPAAAAIESHVGVTSQTAQNTAPVERLAPRVAGRLVFRAGVLFLGLCAGTVIGLSGWASRQPVVERVESGGRLFFAGDSHDLKASFSGRLAELRISPGQKVSEGTVLAVVHPPHDEAKLTLLGSTLARAKSEIEFCEKLLSGGSVTIEQAPNAIALTVRNFDALRSELRVKRAIGSGLRDDPSLSVAEKALVDAHFAAVSADRSARVDAAQNDSSVKREDLAEAEQALREAQAELRLQISSATELRAERGEDAKLSAAAAARAIASCKRAVSQRQESVNRIRREISSIRVAPVSSPGPAADPDGMAKLEAAIREAEKEIRSYSASMRVLAIETRTGLEHVSSEAAPRQIIAARAGFVDSVVTLPKGTEVSETTVLGRLVTRTAWELELPDAVLQFLKLGRRFAIFKTASDGSEIRVDAYFTGIAEGAGANRARFTTTASDDGWRQGDMFRIKTDAVVGSLLDRWLVEPSSIFR